jgi:hypothetical protein
MQTNTVEHGIDDKSRWRLSRFAKGKVYSAIAMANVMALVVAQAHFGFLIILIIAPLTVWLTYSAYVLVTRPYLRLAQLICIGIWAVAIGAVVLVHYVRHISAREDANEVVHVIRDYAKANGRCSLTLEDLTVNRPNLPEKLKADFAYSCEKGKPSFSYEVTYTVFDRYVYDFEQRVWNYQDWSKKKAWLDTW